MSVPASRDAPRNETKYRYFKFKRLWFCERIKIPCSFMSVMLCAPSWTLLARLLRKLRSCRRRPYDLRRALFHGVIGPLNPQHHHRALSAFQTHRTVGSGFPSLATMLRRFCQPCGNQGVLCHASLPHGLVPPKAPIKRSRVPGHLVIQLRGIVVTVTTAYFILHNKACGY